MRARLGRRPRRQYPHQLPPSDGPSGTLLLIERVIPAANEPSVSKWMDLTMLVVSGGRERTEQEYRTLLERAGFVLSAITPTAADLSLIEEEPRR